MKDTSKLETVARNLLAEIGYNNLRIVVLNESTVAIDCVLSNTRSNVAEYFMNNGFHTSQHPELVIVSPCV